MDIDLRDVDPRVDAPQRRVHAGPQIALHERLVISALVAGVNLWIRVGEIIPDRRRH
jgi:hypothetical protein